jgi:acyl-CoA synthetase (AMP-forming)/AMP-acid ligase II
VTTLVGTLVRTAETRPELRLGCVDDQITLADALGWAAARAGQLLDSGVQPGERIAVVAPTSTDYLVTWLAALLAGTPIALVNPTYPPDLLDRMLAPLGPAAVLGDGDVGLARTGGSAALDGLPGLEASGADVVSFMHTSGTTGLPKFCAQTNTYFLRLAAAMGAALELTPSDRVLAPLPLFHINPMGYGVIGGLVAGADALTVPRFSASGFWPVVREHGISVLVLHAPPVEILKRTAGDPRGHRVRTMFYADREFLQRFGIPRAVSGYGSTEAAGVTHLKCWAAEDDVPDDASRHGGPARDDIDWRLDDDGGIRVRERVPDALFAGYVTSDGLDPARDADGWFDTGDLGRGDGDGGLVFLERAAESIRVKGEFVPIPFVESRLTRIAGLTDLAIWKRPGAVVDDEVVLYAVADPMPTDELAAAIRELPPFMRPVAVARVAQIPRDAAAGKVQRRLLTDLEVVAWLPLT